MIELFAYQLMPGACVRLSDNFAIVESIKGTYVHGRGLLVDVTFVNSIGKPRSVMWEPTKVLHVTERSILL